MFRHNDPDLQFFAALFYWELELGPKEFFLAESITWQNVSAYIFSKPIFTFLNLQKYVDVQMPNE